jgi:hypothetical protein
VHFASSLSGGGERTSLRSEVKNSHSTSEITSPDQVVAVHRSDREHGKRSVSNTASDSFRGHITTSQIPRPDTSSRYLVEGRAWGLVGLRRSR